ncbi:hypothetical protein BDZ94DRAFT_1222422 [Collybia nuda]|uniref:Uncharacterized protein n=1 Tax=Collybia nuda TaxID=64659 RepID=A0A9P5Y030_9AGAR|nr:hypothetical protein BDZ94DRAFT_1222422 [Collybia nuda]
MSNDSLRYNIRWVEHTFTSRNITESLLSPERESGNITTNDYEAATAFLPGFHRHYRLIGSTVAIPLTLAFRQPTWNTRRTYLFLTTASLAGFVVGHVISLSAHFKFVRSIENPVGFSHAMENIRMSTGGSAPPGPIIVREGGKWSVEHDPDAPPTEPHSAPAPPTNSVAVSSSIKHPSKWDQIRNANSRTANSSSWDLLRQNHERGRMASGRESEDDPEQIKDYDRAAEQAKFNALLEKERNFG